MLLQSKVLCEYLIWKLNHTFEIERKTQNTNFKITNIGTVRKC